MKALVLEEYNKLVYRDVLNPAKGFRDLLEKYVKEDFDGRQAEKS